MKKKESISCIIYLLLFFVNITNVFAQKRTPETDEKIYIKIAQETCNCVEIAKVKIDFQKYENRIKLDSCMSVAVLNQRIALGISDEIPNIITPEIALTLSNLYASPALSFLIKNCNSFSKSLYESMWYESSEKSEMYAKEKIAEKKREEETKETENGVDSTEYKVEPVEPYYGDETSPILIMKGKIEKLETKNYTFLIIKNLEGKEEKFIWLRNFGYDIAESLSRNFKKYKGKNVKIEYGETEVFDTKTKKFVIHREIYSLEWE